MAAATLSAATDAANGPLAGTLSVTSDQASGTIYAVVTTSATTPTHAQIVAGTNHSDAAAAWAGSVAAAASANALAATGLTRGTEYFAHFAQVNAGLDESTPISGNGFTTSLIAVLSAGTDTAVGQLSALLECTCDLAAGSLFAVVTTSATSGTHDQIAAGQDDSGAAAAWAGFVSAAAGVNTLVSGGLTPGTAYTAHFAHSYTSGTEQKATPVKGNGLTTPAASINFVRPAMTYEPVLSQTLTANGTTNVVRGTRFQVSISGAMGGGTMALYYRETGGSWTLIPESVYVRATEAVLEFPRTVKLRGTLIGATTPSVSYKVL